MKRNPRPRKYESAAARQAAYKARAEVLEFRAEPKTASSLTSIAQELDVSRSELLLSMVKFALTNHDWARFGLTHKTLPYYQGNPIMATKKASPAQLAARKKFAEMARSGAFKKAKVTRRKANPTKGEKTFKAGDMVITDRKEIGQVTFLKKQPNGFADVYKLLDVKANDPYKSTFLENGNFINGTRLKAYKKRVTAKVKSNPMEGALLHLYGNKYGQVKQYGNGLYTATIFQKVNTGISEEMDYYVSKEFKTKGGAARWLAKHNRMSNPIVPNENFDYVMIQDIKLVAENDANLYRRQGRPIVENLAKKMAKGTFDAAKAVKLYEYLADLAVKDYSVSQLGKRTPTLTILSKPERQVLAQQLFESYADEIKDAAKEIMAKSGKKTTRTNPSKRTSSRSAVVPNPAKKRSYTVYCQVDGQSINSWTKLATFYSATKATQYAKAYAKQYPTHYVRVESHG